MFPPTLTVSRLRRTPAVRRAFACLLAGLVLMAAASLARAEAENSEVIAKVTKLNKKAIDEYESLNFEEARKILKDALELCSQNGLDRHAIAARTYVHLGVVTLSGFKQRDAALKYFRTALEIQPGIKLTKSLANPEVQEAFDEAAGGGKTGAAAAGGTSAEGLSHEPVTRARQGNVIPISATLDAGLHADKVSLSYRPEGETEFVAVDMSEVSPGNYAAEIPVSATAGRTVAYYLEAQKDGQPVAARGSRESPLLVSLAPAVVRKPRKNGDEKPAAGGGEPTLYFGLTIGSGFGWATGNGDVDPAHKVSPGGFAPATLGQLEPEIGYFVRPGLLLSLQGRIQLLSGLTSETCAGCTSPSTYALAVFAKVTWLLGADRLRPFFSLAAGGGYVRHVVEFKNGTYPECGTQPNMTCVESVPGGAVLVGPGAGILYAMTPALGLVLGVGTQLGFPKFTFNVDINVGLSLSF
jgi:hypothetical protein